MQRIKKKCLTCKIQYLVINSRKKTSKYCSHKCQGKSPYSKNIGKRMLKLHKGIPKTKSWKKKASVCKISEKNPMWKGYNVGLAALHKWVSKRLLKPKECKDCKIKTPYDLCNISNKYNKKTYTRDLKNWLWLCRLCHMKRDGRLKNLK